LRDGLVGSLELVAGELDVGGDHTGAVVIENGVLARKVVVEGAEADLRAIQDVLDARRVTTATEFDGFQVSSITTGKVLFTVSFGAVPAGFSFSAPSHGIALSPNEKTLYVIDSVQKEIQFWDVSRVKEGVAPSQLGVVPVAGLSGEESPCTYDCTRGGWLQLSTDGRFLFVGDSGEVIETATSKVITSLPTLLNTKKSIEVDWQNGVPIATSGRTGVGQIE
jgi:hypothetical protein